MSYRLTLLSASQPMPAQADPKHPATPKGELVSDTALKKLLGAEDDDGGGAPPPLASRDWACGHELFEIKSIATIIVTYLGNPGYSINHLFKYDLKIVLEELHFKRLRQNKRPQDNKDREEHLELLKVFDPEHSMKLSIKEKFLDAQMDDDKLIMSLADLKKRFSKIQFIHFVGNNNAITDIGLIELSKAYPMIKELSLNSNARDCITDAGLKSCAISLHSLTIFKLSGQNQVSDEGIQSVVEANPKLTEISLCSMFLLTDDSLSTISKKCRKLEQIHLALPEITDDGIDLLLKNHPNLSTISLFSDLTLGENMGCSISEVEIIDLVIKYPKVHFLLDNAGFHPSWERIHDPEND